MASFETNADAEHRIVRLRLGFLFLVGGVAEVARRIAAGGGAVARGRQQEPAHLLW
jgi:hypothetical protein